MADERRVERLEDRISGIEEREAERNVREARRDVKVEVATGAMNRLAALVATAGLGLVGAVVTFVLTGGH